MPTARDSLAAAVGQDGLIYVMGGEPSGGLSALATLEIYDPVRDAWSTGPSLPTARTNLAAATGNDGHIYAIGGIDATGTNIYATVEAYDPVAQVWSTTASLSAGRFDLSAVTGPDGAIYALGGSCFATPCPSAEALSAGDAGWGTVPPLPSVVSRAGASIGADGQLYLIGGQSGLQLSALVQTFDTTTQSWTSPQSALNVARSFLGAALGGDGRIYAVGGFDNGVAALDAVEVYVPSFQSWAWDSR